MGLEPKRDITYVSLVKGLFEVRCPKGTPGSVKRAKSDNSGFVNVLQYGTLSGGITRIERKDKSNAGKSWTSLEISVKDEDKTFLLQLPYFSNTAKDFFYMMEAIDYKKRLNFSGLYFKEDDRTKLMIYQEGGTGKNGRVMPLYSKDNPGKKPDWEWKEINGKPTPDRTKELAYFQAIIDQQINPFLESIHGQPQQQAAAPQQVNAPQSMPQTPPVQQATNQTVYHQPIPPPNQVGVPNHYEQLQGTQENPNRHIPVTPTVQPQAQPPQLFQQVANQQPTQVAQPVQQTPNGQHQLQNFDGNLNMGQPVQQEPVEATADDLPF